jgi:hypothetical protein
MTSQGAKPVALFRLPVQLTDHTGTVTRATLFGQSAERLLGLTVRPQHDARCSPPSRC